MRYSRFSAFCLVTLCVLFLSVPVSLAHRVIIFAWIEGETVHTVSKFPGGSKVVDSPVAVYDDQGDRLLDGKTDEQGNFSFPVPKPTALKIVLEAGAGHQGEWTLSEKEVAAALGDRSSPAPETNSADEAAAQKTVPTPGAPESSVDAVSVDAIPVSGISAKQIEAIVERSVDKKLQPMMRLLTDMHDPGPSLTEIFGGIGYILGLFGVAAFVAARKQKK